MEPSLRGLVIEVLNGRIDSENFNRLMFETGIRLDEAELNIASHILVRKEEINSVLGDNKNTIH